MGSFPPVELAGIVGYIRFDPPGENPAGSRRQAMKVSDILRVKGNTLYTVAPDEPLARAIDIMAEKDIGSLVVMDHGDLVGMLTFREVIQCIVANQHVVGSTVVRTAMDDHPVT